MAKWGALFAAFLLTTVGVRQASKHGYTAEAVKKFRTAVRSFFHKPEVESVCQQCLDEGEDYCISENKCIPRATFQCHGPHDHITGDKEFALHGNPEGIQHSMVCPAAKEQSLDCYFDKECHAKVDWTMIKAVKMDFFQQLKELKAKEDKAGVKELLTKAHKKFQEAGMPEDRIDYILLKWTKTKNHYPEAPGRGSKDKSKDCYFDKECHGKVDWTKIEKIKDGFFGRLKLLKAHDDKGAVKNMMAKVHEVLVDAGMPDDRVDYILLKWVKSVYPEALDSSPPEDKQKQVDEKDCYFDKECHGKVDWSKIEKIKVGFFARLKLDKAKEDSNSVKMMWDKTHKMFVEAGVPDDRVDYILWKWVKYVYPEALDKSAEKDKQADKQDCYFDRECHAKVDWSKVEKVKDGFFARLKIYKAKGDADAKKEIAQMMDKVKHAIAEAGVPEDRVDYMVFKWMKSVDPEVKPHASNSVMV
jgi:uncharacterized protein YlaI